MLHVGARERRVGDVGHHAVHGVTHLVHEGLHLVEAEQRRLVAHRLGEVAHHLYERPHLLAVHVALSAEFGHPGSAPLRRSGIHVEIEHTHESCAVVDLVDLHVGVVDLDVRCLHELDSVEGAVEVEDTLTHLVQLEVGTQQLGVEAVFLLFQFLAPVGEIPALQLIFHSMV